MVSSMVTSSLLVAVVADERLDVALALFGGVRQLVDDVVEVVVVLRHDAAECGGLCALPRAAGHGPGAFEDPAGQRPQVLHRLVTLLAPSLGFRRRQMERHGFSSDECEKSSELRAIRN